MAQNAYQFSEKENNYLARCVDLAEEAFKAGDAPFGSILVNNEGQIIAEDRNRANAINALAHPEYTLAEWAIKNLTIDERRKTTMYTSGEHCVMCSGANAWAEIGKIVYLSSGQQLENWSKEAGNKDASLINYIPIQKVAPHIEVKGPREGKLLERIKVLQLSYFKSLRQ